MSATTCGYYIPADDVRPYTGWRMVLAWAVILGIDAALWCGIVAVWRAL